MQALLNSHLSSIKNISKYENNGDIQNTHRRRERERKMETTRKDRQHKYIEERDRKEDWRRIVDFSYLK